MPVVRNADVLVQKSNDLLKLAAELSDSEVREITPDCIRNKSLPVEYRTINYKKTFIKELETIRNSAVSISRKYSKRSAGNLIDMGPDSSEMRTLDAKLRALEDCIKAKHQGERR